MEVQSICMGGGTCEVQWTSYCAMTQALTEDVLGHGGTMGQAWQLGLF
jgi:hypothetical protein